MFRVALVYDSKEPTREAEHIYAEFPRPLTDPNSFKWWPVAPYKTTNQRTRLEVVADLKPFIGDGMNIEERLTQGSEAAAGELLRLAGMYPTA